MLVAMTIHVDSKICGSAGFSSTWTFLLDYGETYGMQSVGDKPMGRLFIVTASIFKSNFLMALLKFTTFL